MEGDSTHMLNVTLQNVFYVVAIITMSLVTLLLAALIIVLFYIRAKLGEIVNVVEKRLDEAKDIITHPSKMAETVGEAIVDTAVNQVSKLTGNGKKRRRYTRA